MGDGGLEGTFALMCHFEQDESRLVILAQREAEGTYIWGHFSLGQFEEWKWMNGRARLARSSSHIQRGAFFWLGQLRHENARFPGVCRRCIVDSENTQLYGVLSAAAHLGGISLMFSAHWHGFLEKSCTGMCVNLKAVFLMSATWWRIKMVTAFIVPVFSVVYSCE